MGSSTLPSPYYMQGVTTEGGAALRLLDDAGHKGLRGRQADPWLTLAGWLWAAYLAVLAGAALWWLSG